MWAFFHGWRRKAGGVTLAMALAVMGMWMRSLTISDVIEFTAVHRKCVILSAESRLSLWVSNTVSEGGRRSYWRSSFTPLEIWTAAHHQENFTGIICGGLYTFVDDVSPWVARYSFVTIPLTLLSAYLILWKPRKREAQHISSVSPNRLDWD